MHSEFEDRLSNLVEEEFMNAANSLDAVDRRFSGAAYGSAAWATEREATLRQHFRDVTTCLATLISQADELNESAKRSLLDAKADVLARKLEDRLAEDYPSRPPRLDEFARKLSEDRRSLTVDFALGIVLGTPLRPNVHISTTTIKVGKITGGHQQIAGAGAQQSIVIAHRLPELLDALDRILAGPELGSLPPSERSEIEELAKEVREEAKSPTPDGGKLRNLGSRLLHRLASVGAGIATEVLRATLAAALSSTIAL